MTYGVLDILSSTYNKPNPEFHDVVFEKRRLWLEKNASRNELIQFKKWAEDNKNLPPVSDNYLLLFLNARDFNIEQAKTLLMKYVSLRRECPALFTKRHPKEDLYNAYQQIYICPMPITHLTPCGGRLVIYSVQQYQGSTDIASWLKCGVASIDLQLAQCGPSNGVHAVYDAKNFSFKHVVLSAIPLLRKSLQFTQEAMPAKLMAVHVIRMHPVAYHMLSIIKPFLTKRIVNLLHVYTEDKMEEFYKNVGQDNLPEDFGGKMPSMHSIHWSNYERMMAAHEYLANLEKLFTNSSTTPIEKSLKNLEID